MRPVFALGFDDVLVGEEEDGLSGAAAVVADDEVGLFGRCAAEEDVGVGESGGLEAGGGGFGDGGGGAGGEAGLDFDELLVNGAGELPVGVGREWFARWRASRRGTGKLGALGYCVIVASSGFSATGHGR